MALRPSHWRPQKRKFLFPEFSISLNIEWIYDLIRFVSSILFNPRFFRLGYANVVWISPDLLASLWWWKWEGKEKHKWEFTVCLSELKRIIYLLFFHELQLRFQPSFKIIILFIYYLWNSRCLASETVVLGRFSNTQCRNQISCLSTF